VLAWLLGGATLAQAQVNRPTRADTLAAKKLMDSLSGFKMLLKTPRPYALRVGTDVSYFLGPFAAALFGPNDYSRNLNQALLVQRAELATELVFNDNLYALAAEVGVASITRSSLRPPQTTFQYKNSGYYFRLGADYNFFQQKFDDQALTLGFRYGRANFSHELLYYGVNPAWGFVYREGDSIRFPDEAITNRISPQRLSAGWFEITSGLRVKIWRGVVGGFTFRVKTMLRVRGEDRLLANELPGFGAVRGNLKLSFNYHLYYQFPLKKKRLLGKIRQL
jgi:Domain of unknown function (DUF6048)